jgi:CHAT domain/Periplasmic binding protein
MVKKILVLTANPNDTNRLRADLEMQGIQERLRRANQGRPNRRNQFELVFKCARPDTLLDDIEDERPEFVHFCGHGTQQGIILEDMSGNRHLVETRTLQKLFKRCAGHVKCVILNACHSEVHAQAISEDIPYTIGMEGAIWDRAAIQFAGAFYKGLADGKSIEFAFEGGLLAAQLINPDEDPKLFRRNSSTFLSRILQSIEYIKFLGLELAKSVWNCISGLKWTKSRILLIIISGVVAIAIYFLGIQKPLTSSGRIALFKNSKASGLIEQATNEFRQAEDGNQNYELATRLFRKAIEKDKNNPEPYIYRNNSLVRQKAKDLNRKIYILVAAIPASSEESKPRALEMLRGIADAQNCFNSEIVENRDYCPTYPKDYFLEIRLIDDRNDPSTVRKVAEKIVADAEKNTEILGVIGHYASGVTSNALSIYSINNMPIISPGSTSSNLKNGVFFRTNLSGMRLANMLAQYVGNKGIKKVIGFLDDLDPYSISLWNDFDKIINKNVEHKYVLLNNENDVKNSISEIEPNKNSIAFLIPPSAPTKNFKTVADGLIQATQTAESLTSKGEDFLIGGNILYSSKTLNPDGSKFKGMVLAVP